MQKNKRVTIDYLEVLTTHKCNLSCGHCLRGPAQDVSLSPELGDKFFSQVNKVYKLMITGGEPTLDLPTLRGVLESVKKHGVEVGVVQLATNGTNITDEFVDVMNGFKEHVKCGREQKENKNGAEKLPEVVIHVSMDEFHEKEIYGKKTIEQLEVMWDKIANTDFRVCGEYCTDQPLANSGRAIQIKTFEKIDPAPTTAILLKAEKQDGITYHMGPFVGMDARGNIAHTECATYKQIQKNTVGNIADTDLVTLLTRYADIHTTSPAEYVKLKNESFNDYFRQFAPKKETKVKANEGLVQ